MSDNDAPNLQENVYDVFAPFRTSLNEASKCDESRRSSNCGISPPPRAHPTRHSVSSDDYLHPEIERWLTLQQPDPVARRSLRVLDFGAGHGRSLARLHELGFDVFATDVSESAMEEARTRAEIIGVDPSKIQSMTNGAVPFDSNLFHLVITQQVLEHVPDLPAVTSELSRLVRHDGATFHSLPARFRPIEPHLRLPMIHWLPNHPARRYAIQSMMALGLGPEPKDGLPLSVHAHRQNAYLSEHTFYRSYRVIARTFEASGFSVRSVALNHPRLDRLRVARSRCCAACAERFLRTFVAVNIEACPNTDAALHRRGTGQSTDSREQSA